MSEQNGTEVTVESPEVVAAAKWWADALRGPVKFDNGDPSPSGGLAWAMATMSAAERKTAPEVFDRFEAILRQSIVDYSRYHNGWLPIISVDYDADLILRDAMTRAGGEAGITAFPWKTCMWINKGKVTVRHGYGAPEQVIYGESNPVK